jgi:hypothetical protein
MKKWVMALVVPLLLLPFVIVHNVQADAQSIERLIEQAVADSPDGNVLIELTEDQLRELLLSRGFTVQETEAKIMQPKLMLQQMRAAEAKQATAPLAQQWTITRAMNYCCTNGAETTIHVGAGGWKSEFLDYSSGNSLSTQIGTCSTGSYCAFYHADAYPQRCYRAHRLTGYDPLGYYYVQCRP